MSEAYRRFARALRNACALVVKPVGSGAWFLNYPFRPWRRTLADRERLDLLRLLLPEAPVCGFLVDDDHYETLLAAIGVERSVPTSQAPWLFLPTEDALRSLDQLYEGNWSLFLFDRTPTEPPPVPRGLGLDPDTVRQCLDELGASVAVLSLPDDLEWLVVLAVREVEPPLG